MHIKFDDENSDSEISELVKSFVEIQVSEVEPELVRATTSTLENTKPVDTTDVPETNVPSDDHQDDEDSEKARDGSEKLLKREVHSNTNLHILKS